MSNGTDALSPYIRPGEHNRLARLFEFLYEGEQLSMKCARKQAELTTCKKARRFLKSQAHQEAYHSKVFHAGMKLLTTRGSTYMRSTTAMKQFREYLEHALHTRQLSESLLAQQVILEGLGEVTLTVLNEGMNKRNMPLTRLRHSILRQEQAHHEFGATYLNKLIIEQNSTRQSLCNVSHKYLESADAMLEELMDVFEYFDEDPAAFKTRFYLSLPVWLRPLAE